MTISNDKVKAIQGLTVDLGEIIHSINPVTDKEWSVFERLVQAHTALRKADTDALLQLLLPGIDEKPATPEFREDCPRCSGSGKYIEQTDQRSLPRPCNCNEVEDEAWENIKMEWETQLQPSEV